MAEFSANPDDDFLSHEQAEIVALRRRIVGLEAELTLLRKEKQRTLKALQPFAEFAETMDDLAAAGQRNLQPEDAADLTDEQIAALVTPDEATLLTDGRMAFGRRAPTARPAKITAGDLRALRAVYRDQVPAEPSDSQVPGLG